MLGDDVNFLRWLQKRIASGNFSLENHYDHMAVERLGKLVKGMESEIEKVPGPSQPPYHPFMKEWA